MSNRIGSPFLVLLVMSLLSACQPQTRVCPPTTGTPPHLKGDAWAAALSATPEPFSTPISVMVGGRSMVVDRYVNGPLCNDRWRGTVYVGCDVRVAAWTEQPTFLKDCDLQIEPNTVAYVAAHNNTAYYQGCSCHITGTAVP